jgi:hypothetical protein
MKKEKATECMALHRVITVHNIHSPQRLGGGGGGGGGGTSGPDGAEALARIG